MGMVPIRITSMKRQGETWYILGENFTPYCVVTEDGRQLETEYLAPWLLRLRDMPDTTDWRELSISVVDKHNEILSNTE